MKSVQHTALISIRFLEWMHDADYSLDGKKARVITDESHRRLEGKNGITQQGKTSMLGKCDDLRLLELGTEQELQTLRGSVAIQTHEFKNKRIVFMFLQLPRGIQCPVGYLNCDKYLQCTGRASQRRLRSSEKSEGLTKLKWPMLFHRLSFVESLVWMKGLRALHNAAGQTGTTTRMVSQLVMKASIGLCCVAQLLLLFEMNGPYIHT